MQQAEQLQRADVVKEALSWVGTPFMHAGRIKGVGVDCGQLPIMVFSTVGLIKNFYPESYSRNWHMHSFRELYLEAVKELALEVSGPPLPGDLIIWRFGRHYSHGGIVTQWPKVVHAFWPERQVTESDTGKQGPLRSPKHPIKHFSYWAKAAVTEVEAVT